jgi:hypothetical protein
VLLTLAILLTGIDANASETREMDTALLLADILRAARTEIANQQAVINNPNAGNKNLPGKVVVQRALVRLRNAGKTNPLDLPANSKPGRLVQAQLAAIEEVIDENRGLINTRGVGFKGFVPAVFARLANERFGDKVGDTASIKVTAPAHLVRNRKARPDEWEREVLDEKFQSDRWPRGKLFWAVTAEQESQAFRMIVPEYYSASCLDCHGQPKGAIDITGYPKEGGLDGDLGGAISIILFRN